ncbi:hypothetical protein PR048_021293 [Dryococelus australis]|uniref:Uncharacterized protein n=1 Tax=Dryococelus australis TaxID=614101 RepID=A0ABQ9GXZ7_9NEOP|nr:hypothetical protein PR048_021293 [Dryococelus australis]
MRPLEFVLMAPLSQYYTREADKCLLQRPGRSVPEKQVAELYGKAFKTDALMQTGVDGFRKTGIYPFDPNIFPDYLFQPSGTTERPAQAQIEIQENNKSCCKVDLMNNQYQHL